jgi:hypothetical protein
MHPHDAQAAAATDAAKATCVCCHYVKLHQFVASAMTTYQQRQGMQLADEHALRTGAVQPQHCLQDAHQPLSNQHHY